MCGRPHHFVYCLGGRGSILKRNEGKVRQCVVAIAEIRHDLGWVGTVSKHVQQRDVGHEVKPGEDL